eukprot:XP_027316262.1 tudor domain-containing protein 1 [Anas platyrhynchos]
MAEPLHAKYSGNKVAGSSMEGTTSRRKLPQAAGTDKGNTVSHSDLIEEPKKLQYSYENAFSIGYDRSLFNSLASPPQTKTCHRCGLFGSLRCSRCRQINYCSVDCQKEDWPSHRVVCEPVKQNSSNNNGGKIPAKTETGLYLKGNSTSVDSLKTEEQCKKIMLSDLQSLGLKKAMEVQGTVTEFRSPSEFYMQMSSPEVLDQISKLSVKLQDCYANTVIQEHYVAIKGEVCVARNSLDQMWSRALVKDVDTSQKKAQVLYIDYGKEENIPLSWIKALCKDIELLPPCAIKCSFANYEPKQRGWNEGDDIFSSQLVGKTCSVIVVDILQEEMMSRFAVDVVRPNFCKCLLWGWKWARGEVGNTTVKSFILTSPLHNTPQDPWKRIFSFFGSLPPHRAHNNVLQKQYLNNLFWNIVASLRSEGSLLVYLLFQTVLFYPSTYCSDMDCPLNLSILFDFLGVKPLTGAWSSEAISLMKQLVKDKVLTVKVVDKESYRSVVELVDASVIPEINISSYLLQKNCAAKKSRVALPATEISNVKQANEDTANKIKWRWNKLTLQQTVDVIVCTLYNPGEFYCQISNNSELRALNLLNKSLSEYCWKTPPSIFKPKSGEPCCALFSGDGNWYRALVQNVTSDGIVKVCFMDYGNVEEVPLDKIRQIPSSFLQLPFQGIKCWLSGIKPANGKWIPEATERFHAFSAGMKLQAKVTSLSRDGAGVELINNSTGYPKVINEILTSEKLAVREDLQDKSNLPNKSDNKETSVGRWKPIELAMDETIPVCVTEVVSPDLFYAIPVQSKDHDKLLKQMIELDDYCKSCKMQSFTPKLGEACCARFSGNGRWYRALVLKVSQSTVKVLYADCGNTETLPVSHVLPITDSYLKFPFQTITCSLAGIKKAECSPLLLDKLKEMLLNKYVTITVKGINENVNLVKVEKQCENGSLNIIDKLVAEGLICKAENSDIVHQGNGSETRCCCTELKMQLKKHEQILLFLLNKYGNPDGFSEMKKLLDC